LPSISAWLWDRQLAYSHWWWSESGLKLTIGTMNVDADVELTHVPTQN
jgi:hypothetical protein